MLYKEVLTVELPWLDKVEAAKAPRRLPVVLSRMEVAAVLSRLEGSYGLIARLLYGTGLRIMECLRLRVKDVDFARGEILVRDGKGFKDRVTMLPASVAPALRDHLERVRELHRRDLAEGHGEVHLPYALDRKYPAAGREWMSQYIFPSAGLSVDPRRWHRQTRHAAHPAPQLRHPPAGRRLRHPHGAGTARPFRRQDHHDLHPCPQPRRALRGQSRRSHGIDRL
jgi:integrase